MTEEYIEIHWTSGSLEEARRLSRNLVELRLVACAQIIPWIESIYLWNGQVDTAQESKIVFKTKLGHYEKIREYIEKNTTYEVPEITWHKISGGNACYMKWLQESLFQNRS